MPPSTSLHERTRVHFSLPQLGSILGTVAVGTFIASSQLHGIKGEQRELQRAMDDLRHQLVTDRWQRSDMDRWIYETRLRNAALSLPWTSDAAGKP